MFEQDSFANEDNAFDSSKVEFGDEGNMGVLAATEALLTAIGKPLNCVEITRLILKKKMWISEGKTPDATVGAQLAVDIKKNARNSRFQRTAPGIFALRAWGLDEYSRNSSPIKKTRQTHNDKKAEPPVVSLSLTQRIYEHNKAVYGYLF